MDDSPAAGDGERYLRLLLEDAMETLAPDAFHEAARVLVAAGAVEAELAAALEWDLSLASSLRAHGRGLDGRATAVRLWPGDYPAHRVARGWQPPAPPPEPVGVATGPATFEVPGGKLTVAFITTGPGARAHVMISGPDADIHHPQRNLIEALQQVSITDERGVSYHAGGGGGGGSHGYWTFDQALDPEPPSTVRWFDVTGPDGSGRRLAVSPAQAPSVSLREPRRSRPEITLLEAVVTFAARGHGVLPAAAEALVGAGLLAPDHPLITQASLVQQHPPAPTDPRLSSALRPQGDPPPPLGVLSACLPVAAVVRSEAGTMACDALAVLDGTAELHCRFDPWHLRPQLPFAVLARDDLEQWYLGHPGAIGRQADWPAQATLRFTPRLDPAASEFVIVVIAPEGETDLGVRLR